MPNSDARDAPALYEHQYEEGSAYKDALTSARSSDPQRKDEAGQAAGALRRLRSHLRLLVGGVAVIGLLAGGAYVAVPLAQSLETSAVTHDGLDAEFYEWCMKNIGTDVVYCCNHSGGNVEGDVCVEPPF